MDCPHLSQSVKIDSVFVRNKAKSNKKIWFCLECKNDKENWMCLNCGKVLCGRYHNSHALEHSTAALDDDHKICMNTLNQTVFCYQCDDFVLNETEQLMELRRELELSNDSSGPTTTAQMTPPPSSSASSTSEESSSSNGSKVASSVGSADSGWGGDEVSSSGRKLRPRKRTISSDSCQVTSSGTAESHGQGNGVVGSTTAPATNQNKPAPGKRSKLLKKVVGLRNLGNTCFMNSVLQSLSNIQEFSCYFSALPSVEQLKQQQKRSNSKVGVSFVTMNGHGGGLGSIKETTDDANVVEELRKVLLNLSQGGDGSKAISPECLFLVIWKVVPQFRGHRQHDAHEFLRYMLDRLHTELQHFSVPPDTIAKAKQISGGLAGGVSSSVGVTGSSSGDVLGASSHFFRGRSSIVTNVFGGVLQSEVCCLICGMESKKHDPFLDLSLDIPERFYKECDEQNPPVCNIADCLSSFTEVEELAETELYYCNSCKCKQKSTKRFWIRRLPNVLCLHIKRFRWSNFFRTKIDLRISFPITSLDMSQFVLNNGPETRRSNSSNNIYDLAAVIVHHGNGSSCGHYTSYAINNGTWLHFNDHTVKEVPSSSVADCKPYILFYIRRDAAGGVGSSTAAVSSSTASS